MKLNYFLVRAGFSGSPPTRGRGLKLVVDFGHNPPGGVAPHAGGVD